MTGPRNLALRLQQPISGVMHNPRMNPWLLRLLFSLALAWAAFSPLQAQDPGDEQGSDSSEVEESDEEYRRRMELEDARQRDLGYTLPAPTYAQKQEKLDKLPEESRDNIRDQLVDIIVENGDWQPSDALKEYPYEPTAAAAADPELMQQEQEAWDEQIGKYHKREAAAYGTYLGPAPGPGNPDGGEGGGQAGEGSEGSEQGGGQQGGAGAGAQPGTENGGQDDSAATAGSYDPYSPNRSRSEEAVSTAGVQQSALEFLKAMQGQGQAPAPTSTAAAQAQSQSQAQSQAQSQSQSQAQAQSQAGSAEASAATPANPQAAAEPVQADAEEQPAEETSPQEAESASEAEQQQSTDQSVEIDLTTPGIIAIKDLEKLEGTGATDNTEKRE